jgi:hypothetical protein
MKRPDAIWVGPEVELWANHLRVIVAQAEGTNVTKLRRRAE